MPRWKRLKVCHLHSFGFVLNYSTPGDQLAAIDNWDRSRGIPGSETGTGTGDWFIISLNYYRTDSDRRTALAKLINNQNKSIHSLGARNVKNRNEQIAIATLSLQILFFTLDLHFKLKRLTKTETETQNRTEKRALKTETQLKPGPNPNPGWAWACDGGEKIRNFQPAGMKTARRIGRHCQAAVEIVAWIWGMCGTSNSHGTIRKKSQTESHHLSTIHHRPRGSDLAMW